jgi:hypothetical protein
MKFLINGMTKNNCKGINETWRLVKKIQVNLEFGINKSLKVCGELLIANKDSHNGVK